MRRHRLALLVIVAAGAVAAGGCEGCVGGRTEPPLPRTVPGGQASRGAEIIKQAGCGACHTIPGIPGAAGVVGPPLTALSQRSFIAGKLPNTAENLTRWLLDPHAVEPDTAMPTLGLTVEQARDVAAYLYTLE
jgi:cytochrome c